MNRPDLINEILKIAGGYREGEIPVFDSAHVERWINQFPVSEEHKNVILREVGNMLENFYISREKAKENLLIMLKEMKKERAGGCDITDVNFLRTQAAGKSQHEMLLIADELIQDARGVTTKDCGGSKIFLYLDDALYSGNKFRYDITNSAQLAEAENGITLVSYHFGLYNAGFDYASDYVRRVMAQKGGVLKAFRKDALNNNRFGKEELDILWPTYVAGNNNIDQFFNHVLVCCRNKGWNLRPMFRIDQVVSSKLFTSPINQHIVEQAFLAVGAGLFCVANNPAQSMRPIGFEAIATIGFGTPIITWRNIANNCPLALWYGDPAFGPNHPLGMWYPLFPRKI